MGWKGWMDETVVPRQTDTSIWPLVVAGDGGNLMQINKAR